MSPKYKGEVSYDSDLKIRNSKIHVSYGTPSL